MAVGGWPSSRMILAVGPLTARPPTTGETATTGAAQAASAARRPGSASIGSMLRYGFEGQITTASSPGSASARSASGLGRASAAPSNAMPVTVGLHASRTK